MLIENNAKITIETDFIIGQNGKATVTYTGGEVTIKRNIDVSQSSESKFKMSGGRLTTKEIITARNAFEFTGGELSTKKITGTFTNLAEPCWLAKQVQITKESALNQDFKS